MHTCIPKPHPPIHPQTKLNQAERTVGCTDEAFDEQIRWSDCQTEESDSHILLYKKKTVSQPGEQTWYTTYQKRRE